MKLLSIARQQINCFLFIVRGLIQFNCHKTLGKWPHMKVQLPSSQNLCNHVHSRPLFPQMGGERRGNRAGGVLKHRSTHPHCFGCRSQSLQLCTCSQNFIAMHVSWKYRSYCKCEWEFACKICHGLHHARAQNAHSCLGLPFTQFLQNILRATAGALKWNFIGGRFETYPEPSLVPQTLVCQAVSSPSGYTLGYFLATGLSMLDQLRIHNMVNQFGLSRPPGPHLVKCFGLQGGHGVREVRLGLLHSTVQCELHVRAQIWSPLLFQLEGITTCAEQRVVCPGMHVILDQTDW